MMLVTACNHRSIYGSTAYAAHQRHYVPALSVTAFVLSSARPMPNIFLSLRKNTEWISMKFVGGTNTNRLDEVPFWAKFEQEQGSRI